MLMGNSVYFVYFSPQAIVDNYRDYLERHFKCGALQNYLNPLYIPTTQHYSSPPASCV